MCGIFCIVNDKNNSAAQTVLEGLKKLEYRGYDSWGIAIKSATSNKIVIEKHIGKIGQAKTTLPSGSIAIGHTRWATHGGVTDKNAHPHLDCTKQIAVLHNGIVENYQDLKEMLLSKKHSFQSETDTEVIAHLIEENAKSMPMNTAVFTSFKQLTGSNAIAVIDTKTNSVIACRDGSPLVVGIGDNQYFLASDVTAFIHATNKVVFLNDKDAVVVNPQKISFYNLEDNNEVIPKIQTIDWKIEDVQKGGYPHFLLKEIHDQVLSIPKAFTLNDDAIAKLRQYDLNTHNILFVGCGSAYYCGLAASYAFAQHGIPSQVAGAYELEPFLPFINNKTLIFAISQSGETADTLIAIKQAKQKGATIIGVINARGSTLERISDIILPVGSGPEIAVVSTKAFTAQLATLYKVAYVLKNKEIFAVKETMEKALTSFISDAAKNNILLLAKQLLDKQDVYLIGKHNNYPASLEFALKIKETSYIHSEAFASGELKHGVITLIQKNTPCIVLTANDKIRNEVLSSAAELRARGGYIIGVGPKESKEFDYFIQTPDVDPQLSVFFNVIVGQLLGYYLGVGRGADPDKPRNLAKSVTVK